MEGRLAEVGLDPMIRTLFSFRAPTTPTGSAGSVISYPIKTWQGAVSNRMTRIRMRNAHL